MIVALTDEMGSSPSQTSTIRRHTQHNRILIFSKNKKTNSIQLVVEKFDMQARLDYENYDFDFDKEWKKILDTQKIKKPK